MVIESIGVCKPAKVLTNTDLESTLDTSHEWIFQRTGIISRHICSDDENACSMAIKAALEAVSEHADSMDNSINLGKIKVVIVATSTHKPSFPSIAVHVHRALNLSEDVIAFDINDACNGFVQGMCIALDLIKNTDNKAIVIGTDAMSSILDWSDRSTCILFGDGAGAVILGGMNHSHMNNNPDNSNYLYDKTSYTLSNYADVLYANPNVVMNGPIVFKNAIQCILKDVEMILSRNKIEASEVDFFVPHQANARIIDALKQKVNFKENAVVNIVENCGNTSAATIPLGLHSIKDKLQKGQIILMSGFASGFRGGSILIRI